MALVAGFFLWFQPAWAAELQGVLLNSSIWLPAAGLALAAAILFDLSPARRRYL